VLLVLVVVAALAIAAAGFVEHAPNRLVSGTPVALWQAAAAPLVAAMAVLGAIVLAAAFVRPTQAVAAGVIVAASLFMVVTLGAAGGAARSFAAHAPHAARASLGPAFWIAELAAALAIVDGLQRLKARPGTRAAIVAAVAAAVAALMAGGALDHLSIMREYAIRRDAFAAELERHCALVLGAVLPALALGVPLGIAAGRRPRLRAPLFATLNAVQTVPSIALFGLLIAPLAALAAAVPALAALGVHGVGIAPALIALVLYSLLPVVRNTEAGLRGVDPAAIEAAMGMGMTPRQIFWQVEVPLALPVLLAGLRIVTVQAVGLAAVAALIGAGGLGTFVFQGIGQYAVDLVLLGAVPTILLALAADFALAMAIEVLRRGSL
jgi:osmoprotectant transport system permease protein